MSPDEISKAADKLRDRKPRRKSSFSWKNIFPRRNTEHRSPYSYWVYSRIYPHGFNPFIWIFLVLTAGLVSLLIWYLEKAATWVLYMGLGFCALFVLRWMVMMTGKVSGYGKYKRFFHKPPFTVSGWDRLGSKDFPKHDHWVLQTAVEVKLKPAAGEEQRKQVHDALFLFNNRANKWFYTPNQALSGFGSDPRKKWNFEEPFCVIGSANGGVMGEVYVLLRRHLATIQQHHSCIEAVVVSCKDKAYKIDTVDVD